MTNEIQAKEISVADTKAILDQNQDVLLLDVRRKVEFDYAKIEGAVLVPLQELPDRIEEVRNAAAGRAIITVCHHGQRSMQAANFLQENELNNVRSMAGGIDVWSVEIDQAVPRY